MSSEENKALNLRWIQAFNERDWAAEAACRTPDFVAHMSGSEAPLNGEAWAGFMAAITTSFPDAQIAVEGAVAERDMVASRWTITATHRGTFQGVPPSGKAITMPGVDFTRIVDGRVAEHWAQFDLLAVMQQIGAIPVPA
jgi:steroid delta-isomerase-like uncharacterized protein